MRRTCAVSDPKERAYLNQLPTSFVLTYEQVDRLRAAAAQALFASPEFKRVLTDTGSTITSRPASPQ